MTGGQCSGEARHARSLASTARRQPLDLRAPARPALHRNRHPQVRRALVLTRPRHAENHWQHRTAEQVSGADTIYCDAVGANPSSAIILTATGKDSYCFRESHREPHESPDRVPWPEPPLPHHVFGRARASPIRRWMTMTIVMNSSVPIVEVTVETTGHGLAKPRKTTQPASVRWAQVAIHPSGYANPSAD